MMTSTLHLFDTLTRANRELKPLDGQTFRFYCCGPTVYDWAHIGNFRTFILQDVFRRVMELGGTPTYHVRNLTDVDDKTIEKSQELGQSMKEFTSHWTRVFHEDCAALNLLPPHVEPSAVEHIPQQVAMIARLVEKGHAYAGADGSVYFNIGSWPEYGGLSRVKERELQLGGDENEAEKESVSDFVLWKARKPADGPNFWPSPWGEGRPGWHLECSAMIEEYLGKEFDLHSGGEDLVFPHHENEIAQSCCATGGRFAAHWFHTTHLLADGVKMSKSLGNLYTLRQLQEKEFNAAQVRYVLISAHYRQQLNFTFDSLAGASPPLQRLARMDERLRAAAHNPAEPAPAELAGLMELGVFAPAWAALCDDLNTPLALGRIFSALKELKPEQLAVEEALVQWRGFRFILHAFGLILPPVAEEAAEVPADIRVLAEKRWQARLARDWASADQMRKELEAEGWLVKDAKESYELMVKQNKSEV